tara:strand:- start:73448 stop:73918 length:471 start_codon:yes stop_codon:yes gene_type:complete
MKFAYICLLSLVVIACKDEPKPSISVEEPQFKKEAEAYLVKATGDTLTSLDLEVADDEYQRQTGLMYRNSMQDNQGMLFVFPDEQLRSFYMKNTRIPLDLLFLDEDYKIVDFQEDVKPMSEASLPSKVPAKFVLELNAKQSEALQLEIGDYLLLKD